MRASGYHKHRSNNLAIPRDLHPECAGIGRFWLHSLSFHHFCELRIRTLAVLLVIARTQCMLHCYDWSTIVYKEFTKHLRDYFDVLITVSSFTIFC